MSTIYESQSEPTFSPFFFWSEYFTTVDTQLAYFSEMKSRGEIPLGEIFLQGRGLSNSYQDRSWQRTWRHLPGADGAGQDCQLVHATGGELCLVSEDNSSFRNFSHDPESNTPQHCLARKIPGYRTSEF